MVGTNSLRKGLAFAATATIAFALCTAVFWTWPDAAPNFLNALFHGLDFRKVQSESSMFSFGRFLYAAVVMAIWAFVLGMLFAGITRLLHALYASTRAGTHGAPYYRHVMAHSSMGQASQANMESHNPARRPR